jgi:hypothetical protein
MAALMKESGLPTVSVGSARSVGQRAESGTSKT